MSKARSRKFRLILGILGAVCLIGLAVLLELFARSDRLTPQVNLRDQGVHTFAPAAVFSDQVRLAGPGDADVYKLAYRVRYLTADGSPYGFDVKAGSQQEGLDIVQRQKTVERRVLYDEAGETIVFTAPSQTLAAYISRQERNVLLLRIACWVFLAAALAVFCAAVFGGRKKSAAHFNDDAPRPSDGLYQSRDTQASAYMNDFELRYGEKSSYRVLLRAVGPQKIRVIKIVRAFTGADLARAKGMVDAAPSIIGEQVPKKKAIKILRELEEAGARVELQ